MPLAESRKSATNQNEDFKDLKEEEETPQSTYCSHCRSKLAEKEIDGKKRMACTHCTYVFWDNPIPATAVVIPHKSGGIVLVKRGAEPRKGYWALPAGFMERGETPEQGACREAKEEVCLDIEIVAPIFNFATAEETQVLLFFAAKEVSQTPTPGDDAVEALVFPLNELPSELAFSSHAEAIKHWRETTGQ